ncbi:MAG: DUF6198 family protein [Defluviitaleaceae bacterium]|nr:DUF6198 family protein [Defluviitaleaceae bacterium]
MHLITKRLVARVAVYVLGLLILAFGVVFAINSNLGISPVNSLPFAASLVTGVGMGISVTIFFLANLVLQIVILRRDFKLINLTQIIYSFIFGYFVDFAMFVLGDFTLPTYFGQLTMLAISLILLPTGLSMYLEAKLVPMPSEGFVLAVTQKLQKYTFARIKVIYDCALVLSAITLTLVALGGVYGAREGTVISALLIGKLMPPARKAIAHVLGKLGFYPPPEPPPEKAAAA